MSTPSAGSLRARYRCLSRKLRDGEHWLVIRANGYASQRHRIIVTDSKPSGSPMVQLYRQRYAVVRAAFATGGSKMLDGPDLLEKRMLLTHYSGPKPLGRHEWEVQQQRSLATATMPCIRPSPTLSFNAFWHSYGFVPARVGETFNTMRPAPAEGYMPKPRPAEKGLLLYFRTHGRNTNTEQGYGKLLVEEVLDTRLPVVCPSPPATLLKHAIAAFPPRPAAVKNRCPAIVQKKM